MDLLILNYINENLRSPALDFAMKFFTYIGEYGTIWIIIALSLLFFKQYRKYGIIMLISLTLCLLLGEFVLKNLISRARPFYIDDDIKLIISPPGGYSFPSGHSASSFAGARVLYKAKKKIGIIAYIVASLIAISRVYLYVHYPSDVLAGALIGTLISSIILYLYNKKFIKL